MNFITWIKSFYTKRPIGNNWAERIDIAINQRWGFSEEDQKLAMDWNTCPVGERARELNPSYNASVAITHYFKNIDALSIGCDLGARISCNYRSTYEEILELFAKVQELK